MHCTQCAVLHFMHGNQYFAKNNNILLLQRHLLYYQYIVTITPMYAYTLLYLLSIPSISVLAALQIFLYNDNAMHNVTTLKYNCSCGPGHPVQIV